MTNKQRVAMHREARLVFMTLMIFEAMGRLPRSKNGPPQTEEA